MADDSQFTKFHGMVLFWCAIIIVFDGYDLAVAGVALPSIMKEMGVEATQAGFMVSSALFGMMFGNVIFGTLADRIGRRWVIAICIVLFSAFTAAAGMMKDPMSFSVMRFLAGLGIGGVMPCVVAQMSEYAPLRTRSTLVSVMFSGYSVGGMLAAVLGKALLESYGWSGVFIAAAVPVLLVPFFLMQMPESMSFLVKNGRTEELKRVLQRIHPGYAPRADDEFVGGGNKAGRMPARGAAIADLFAEGRAQSTIMFWTTCFMCLFMVYALSSWLTKLMFQAGYSLGSALTFVLVLNFGAMIGVIVSMALPMEQNFMAISIPAAIAVFSILLVDHKRSFSMLAQAA